MKTNMNKKLEVRSEKLETNVLISDQWFPARRDKLSAIERPRRSSTVTRNLSPVTSSRQRRANTVTCNLSPVTSLPRQRRRAGFTLIEMLVSLSILIILMAAVGEIFSLAGRTVRVGQATLTAMSSIRAVESQIAHDVKHLDTNGFLIIRQRYYAPVWQPGVQYEPGDEVNFPIGATPYYYLCQQANVTEPAATSPLPPSVPGVNSAGTEVGNLSTADWSLLNVIGGYPIWRADEITFMETGDFHGRTGSVQPFTAPTNATMADYLASNKAIVWFGQFSASYGAAGLNAQPPNPAFPAFTLPTDNTRPAAWNSSFPFQDQFEQPYWPQNAWIPLGTPPSGETSGQFYFGREAMLLIPPGGSSLGSTVYNNPFYPGLATDSSPTANGGSDIYPPTIANSSSGSAGGYTSEENSAVTAEYATVTSSRLDAAYDAIPPSPGFTQPVTGLKSPGGVGTIEGYISSLPLISPSYTSLYDIADFFGYRYSTLITPAASEIGSAGVPAQQALNGYYRMTPIMLQGVPSFAVDWTDGVQNGAAAPYQLNWYGMDGNTGTPSPPYPSPASVGGPAFPNAITTFPNAIAVAGNSGAGVVKQGSTTTPNTSLTYVFYAGNRPDWPKALKITYCVTDPNNRLQGGRFVTQVVNLPQ